METIGTLIARAVLGLVVGLIARLLDPGPQPLGFLGTMLLGIIGPFVGGFISWAFGFRPEEDTFRGAGWIMSIVGAIIAVWAGLFFSSRSSPGARPMV